MPPGTNVQDPDFTFDILRGLAAYTGSELTAALARTVIAHPRHKLSEAFGHRQIACKMWLRDELFKALGPKPGTIWITGGWYGVQAAILLDDARFEIDTITSCDLDPECAAVATTLNEQAAAHGRFTALTADMFTLDYRAGAPGLIINTSCEHIANLPAWLALLPSGTHVVLQSNDYFSEPEHCNCVPDLAAFKAQCNLSQTLFAGRLPTKNYTRFMLIGRT